MSTYQRQPSRRKNLPTQRMTLKPGERDDYGVTMTWINQDGDLRTIARYGLVLQATRQAVSEIESWEGTWKILSVSTPRNIFTDLQGDRDADYTGSPESILLSKIGRPELDANYKPENHDKDKRRTNPRRRK